MIKENIEFFLSNHKEGAKKVIVALGLVAATVVGVVLWPAANSLSAIADEVIIVDETTIVSIEDVEFMRSSTWEIRDATGVQVESDILVNEEEYQAPIAAKTKVVEIKECPTVEKAIDESKKNGSSIYSVKNENVIIEINEEHKKEIIVEKSNLGDSFGNVGTETEENINNLKGVSSEEVSTPVSTVGESFNASNTYKVEVEATEIWRLLKRCFKQHLLFYFEEKQKNKVE